MDRIDRLRTFIAVADRASFAAAARALRVSPTAATRAVRALEEELGVALLRRTTRSVGLTDAGAAYLARARQALADLEDAGRSVAGGGAEPRGLLVVTAPVVYGRLHVVPAVAALLARHAQLEVRLTLVDRVVRLVEEGVDAAVRIGVLPDSALRALRVDSVRRVLVASPAYLAARGEPEDPAGLRGHDLLAVESLSPNGEWRFGPGEGVAVRIAPRLLVTTVDAAVEAACLGCGIARVLDYQVRAALDAGRLRLVLPGHAPAPVPVSLVHAAGRLPTPAVRAFVEEMRGAGPASRAAT